MLFGLGECYGCRGFVLAARAERPACRNRKRGTVRVPAVGRSRPVVVVGRSASSPTGPRLCERISQTNARVPASGVASSCLLNRHDVRQWHNRRSSEPRRDIHAVRRPAVVGVSFGELLTQRHLQRVYRTQAVFGERS